MHEKDALKGKVLVLDVPLLLSSPLRARCDAIVYVHASDEARRRRVADRGWTAEELERRESLQTPLAEKKRLSTVFLDNSDRLEDTRPHVKDLYERWTEVGAP